MSKQDQAPNREEAHGDHTQHQIDQETPRLNETHEPSGGERARQMVTSAVSTTEQVGSGFVDGVAHVASDVVHGVGDVAHEVVFVVRDTATTAISGVETIGEATVNTLTGLLVGIATGVRQIGAAAAGKTPSRHPMEGTEQRPYQEKSRQRETSTEEVLH